MRVFEFLSVVGRRTVVALGVAGMMMMASTAQAQEPPPTPPPAQEQPAAPAPPDPFKFDAAHPAMLMIQINSGSEATFEQAFSAVKTKLAASEKPAANAQARTLNLMKLNTPPAAGQPSIYVVVLDAPVAGASYNIQNMLDEIGEWREDSEIYKQFSTSISTWAPWPLVKK